MTFRLLYALLTLLILAACAPSAAELERQRRMNDLDNDGIINQLDRCPGTGAGIAVDIYGCPHDRDRDGVFDYLDLCPATPDGIAVDPDGCPLDADGDGVPDSIDTCPDTLAGVAVDASGCPVPVAVEPPPAPLASLELQVTFLTGSSRLSGDFSAEFARGAEFIRTYPGSRVTIEGHTDSVGPPAWNVKLSQWRAEVVRRELLRLLGEEVEIITAGYGETRPLAANDNQQGRLQNRRVVIRIDPPIGAK